MSIIAFCRVIFFTPTKDPTIASTNEINTDTAALTANAPDNVDYLNTSLIVRRNAVVHASRTLEAPVAPIKAVDTNDSRPCLSFNCFSAV